MTIVELIAIAYEATGRGAPALHYIPLAEEWVGAHPPSQEGMDQVALIASKSTAFQRAYAGGQVTTSRTWEALTEARYPDLNMYLNAPFC